MLRFRPYQTKALVQRLGVDPNSMDILIVRVAYLSKETAAITYLRGEIGHYETIHLSVIKTSFFFLQLQLHLHYAAPAQFCCNINCDVFLKNPSHKSLLSVAVT